MNSINQLNQNLAVTGNSSTSIRIITYNIHHGLNMNKTLDLAAIASVINKFSPDLVALQELDYKTLRTHGVDQLGELANLTQMNSFFSPAMNYNGGKYGVGILSKSSIQRNLSYALPQIFESEPRTIGIIETQISGKKLMFCSTHLDQKSNSSNRIIQTRKILSILSEIESNGVPIIVGGDFNSKPDSEEIMIMEENFTDISYKLGNTIPSDVPNKKIDYIFISNKFNTSYQLVEGQVIPEKIASDHRPVFVNINLK